MTIESDPNPMPRFELFPRAAKVAHFLLDQFRHEGLSEHGSGPALDRALYDDQPNLFEPSNRWDSEGRYFEE